MLRIGDFASLSQVTVKALRFYDEIGLLKPTFVDRATGYRYYAPHLLSRLNRIRAFKELGFSLAEISSLLNTDLSDERMQSVRVRQGQVIGRMGLSGDSDETPHIHYQLMDSADFSDAEGVPSYFSGFVRAGRPGAAVERRAQVDTGDILEVATRPGR